MPKLERKGLKGAIAPSRKAYNFDPIEAQLNNPDTQIKYEDEPQNDQKKEIYSQFIN